MLINTRTRAAARHVYAHTHTHTYTHVYIYIYIFNRTAATNASVAENRRAHAALLDRVHRSLIETRSMRRYTASRGWGHNLPSFPGRLPGPRARITRARLMPAVFGLISLSLFRVRARAKPEKRRRRAYVRFTRSIEFSPTEPDTAAHTARG